MDLLISIFVLIVAMAPVLFVIGYGGWPRPVTKAPARTQTPAVATPSTQPATA